MSSASNIRMMFWRRSTIAVAVLALGFILWCAAFIYRSSFLCIDGRRYFCLFDDAMISMRYAWNLVHGHGLVWNAGEYVQGYTNLLMTLLMAGVIAVSGKWLAPLVVQVLGAGMLLGIAFLNMRISDHVIRTSTDSERRFVRTLTFLCGFCYYPLCYWALLGMETGLLALLLQLGVLHALKYAQSKKPSDILLTAGALACANLTRMDAWIYALPIWSYLLWKAAGPPCSKDSKPRFLVWICIGLWASVIPGQFLFQRLYYGQALPNTYLLKLTGMNPLTRLTSGIGYILPFLSEIRYLVVPALSSLLFPSRAEKGLLVGMMAVIIGYVICIGGDAWAYWRFMAPCMPCLGVASICFIHDGMSALSNTSFSRNHLAWRPVLGWETIRRCLELLLISGALWYANARFVPEGMVHGVPYHTKSNKRNVNTAIILNRITGSGASIGVFWAGAIPYFTDRRAIDFLGKCDPYVARLPADLSGSVAKYGTRSLPGHNKYDLNYSIRQLKPTYVQGFQYGRQDISEWATSEYARVECHEVSLFLLKGSGDVLWDVMEQDRDCEVER